MRLYIDVDGVLLTYRPDKDGGPFGLSQKDGVPEFIEWATANFDCYWLTAWATNGRDRLLKDKLLPYLPDAAQQIKIAYWSDLKTEAFKDGDGDFLWIDDNLLGAERQFLEEAGWMDNFIRVNTKDTTLAPVVAEIQRRAKRAGGA